MPASTPLPTPESLRAHALRQWHHDSPDILARSQDALDINTIDHVANGLLAIPLLQAVRINLSLSDILSLVPLAHLHWPHYHRGDGVQRLAEWCAMHPKPTTKQEIARATDAWRTGAPTTALRKIVADAWHQTPWRGMCQAPPPKAMMNVRGGPLPAPWHRRVDIWGVSQETALRTFLTGLMETGGAWNPNPSSAAHAGWALTHAPPNIALLLGSIALQTGHDDRVTTSILHALWSLPSVSERHIDALITASRAHNFRPTARCLLRWRAPSPALWAGFWDLVGMGDPTLPWLTPDVAPALWHPGVTEAQRRGAWGALVSSTQRTGTAPRGNEGLRLAHALWIASEALDATDVSTRHLVAGWRGATHPLVARAARRFSLLAPQESSASR